MPEQLNNLLTLSEWTRVSQQRAYIYGWFSALYAEEMSQSTLASWQAGESSPILQGFSAMGFDAEVVRIQSAIVALGEVSYAHLELAADFAQMFLLDANAGALPYASVYESEQTRLYGSAEARMRSFLADASLDIQDEFKEPADHLAIYFAVMERLVTQHAHTADVSAAAHDQASFLEDALLGWLPKFVARNQSASPRFDFYPALAALLSVFAEHDAGFVRESAELSISTTVDA